MNDWILIADIGGTNARFSAVRPHELENNQQFFHSVDEYPNFEDLLSIVMTEISQTTGWDRPPKKVCFAVACPADSEEISFTNSHWSFIKSRIKNILKCEILVIINDFEAVAHGVAGGLSLDGHCRQCSARQASSAWPRRYTDHDPPYPGQKAQRAPPESLRW